VSTNENIYNSRQIRRRNRGRRYNKSNKKHNERKMEGFGFHSRDRTEPTTTYKVSKMKRIITAMFIVLCLSNVAQAWSKPYPLWYEQMINLSVPDCNVADRGYLPKRVFCELPNKPENFDRVTTLYSLGEISGLENINESYWIQPEFVEGTASLWTRTELSQLQTPPTSGYTTISNLKVYPAEFPIAIDAQGLFDDYKSGDYESALTPPYYTFNLLTTVRSAGYQTFYIGVKPYAVYPTIVNIGTLTVNTSKRTQEMSLSFPNLNYNGEEGVFVIAPAARTVINNLGQVSVFPYFTPEYVHLLNISVKVRVFDEKKDIWSLILKYVFKKIQYKPKYGNYAAAVAFDSPSNELGTKMYLSNPDIQYQDAGRYEPYKGFERVKVIVSVTNQTG